MTFHDPMADKWGADGYLTVFQKCIRLVSFERDVILLCGKWGCLIDIAPFLRYKFIMSREKKGKKVQSVVMSGSVPKK